MCGDRGVQIQGKSQRFGELEWIGIIKCCWLKLNGVGESAIALYADTSKGNLQIFDYYHECFILKPTTPFGID